MYPSMPFELCHWHAHKWRCRIRACGLSCVLFSSFLRLKRLRTVLCIELEKGRAIGSARVALKEADMHALLAHEAETCAVWSL